MCGRYYVDEETAKEISGIVMSIGRELRLPGVGDIRPSESAAVIKGDGQDMAGDIMIWGFPKYDKKGLLINARAESILKGKHSGNVLCADGVSSLRKGSMSGIRTKKNIPMNVVSFQSYSWPDAMILKTDSLSSLRRPIRPCRRFMTECR